jgi:hypothetical protein
MIKYKEMPYYSKQRPLVVLLAAQQSISAYNKQISHQLRMQTMHLYSNWSTHFNYPLNEEREGR